MFKNYLTVAIRHIFKNKVYAGINIMGLMIGLTVYMFGSLLVDYEQSYDSFFSNHDRIYTAGTVFTETAGANVGVRETDGVYSAFGPFIKSDLTELEGVARTIRREFLLTIGDDHFYDSIIFADPDFVDIFEFEYIEGDTSALDDPGGVILTESAVLKYFGEGFAVGKTLTMDHDNELHVTAVIRDLPKNSHLTSSMIDDRGMALVAPLAALSRATEWEIEGNFNNLSMGNLTYMLLPADKDALWLQDQLDGIFERHYPEPDQDFIAQLKVRPLVDVNNILWDAIGMPILESVVLLAFLVLVVAIVNYTNLAAAQSLGRAREVGLRKTMGADRKQLLIQFMLESLCIAGFSMLLALVALEILVPVFNNASGRELSLDYLQIMPWILATTLAVGIVAGAYPAYLITRASPIDALSDSGRKGAGGNRFRSLMLGLQFTISIFMLAMVMIVYFQNKKVEEAGNIYPKSEIVTLERLNIDSIEERLETLQQELGKVPGVEGVTYSNQLPYQQSSSSTVVSRVQGDEENGFMIMYMAIDEQFVQTYNIPLLAGRNLSNGLAADLVEANETAANVMVNEMAVERLGYGRPEDAIGQMFYDQPGETAERGPRAYTIVGILPDQNIQGFHNKIKPMFFTYQPSNFYFGSIRVSNVPKQQAMANIENVWKELVPDYPIQSGHLDETFNEVFSIYSLTTRVLAGFAGVAMLLSMIGLFGLAAFMAQSRTREIGIRKVMGASIPQIVRLLVWQFSRPVFWALLLALPAAWFASKTYLNFFANRIEIAEALVIAAGVLAVTFSWLVVSLHAIRVARANPVLALRYE